MCAKKNYSVNGNEYFRLSRTIDGKRKYFYGSSERDARNKYEEYLRSRTRGRPSSTFGEMTQEYVENVLRTSQKYATGTKYRYERSYLVHIKECELKDIPLSNIRPADIQKMYNKLDVTSQTIKGINKFLSAFCKWAVMNEYCSDFMNAVELPTKPDNKRSEEIIVWEESEIQDILSALDLREGVKSPHRLAFFVRVLLYTGARIGEAISLKYSDFTDGTVSIKRQLYMGELKLPKYGSSRVIPMHEELKRLLPIHREWHVNEMQRNGYSSPYVFTTSKGTLYDPVNIRRALGRLYKSNNIPYKHPHAYRATFCTQLCRCGVPMEVTSKLMGHKSLEVTAKHYALVRMDTLEDAINMLHYHL